MQMVTGLLKLFAFTALLLLVGARAQQQCRFQFGLAYNLRHGSHILLPAPNAWLNLESFTVSAWARPTDTSGMRGIVASEQNGLTMLSLNWGLHINEGAALFALSGSPSSLWPSAPIAAHVWTHVAAAFDGASGTASLYLNGSLAAQRSGLSRPVFIDFDFFVGLHNDASSTGPFVGQLDEVAIWGKALSAAEIVAAASSPLLPSSSSGLLLLFAGEGDNATTAIDRSGLGHHGTLVSSDLKNLDIFTYRADCRGCFGAEWPRCSPLQAGLVDVCGDGAVTGEEECDTLIDANCTSTCSCEGGLAPSSGNGWCVEEGGCTEAVLLKCMNGTLKVDCLSITRNIACFVEHGCTSSSFGTGQSIFWSICLQACAADTSVCFELVEFCTQYTTSSSCESNGCAWCGRYCLSTASDCPTGCGNSLLEQGESCDDGNTRSGDGCASNCTIELGWNCSVIGAACTTICGDGIVAGNEECDDGNDQEFDGCSNNCKFTVIESKLALQLGLSIGGFFVLAGLAFGALIAFWQWRKKRRHEIELAALTSTQSFDSTGSRLTTLKELPIRVRPMKLDFGHSSSDRAPVGQQLVQKLTLHPITPLAAVLSEFQLFAPPSSKYTLEFAPCRGKFQVRKDLEVEARITVHCTTKLALDIPFLITMQAPSEFARKHKLGPSEKMHSYIKLSLETRNSTRLDPDEIRLGPCIGEGGFGTVFFGQYRSQDVAVKQLKVQEGDAVSTGASEFQRELMALEDLRSPFIVGFIGAVTLPGRLALVTEYCPLGSLESLLKKKIPYPLKVRICLDCARGMDFLHSSRVMHRDLKPGNLLIVSVSIGASVCCKLTDFGSTRQISEAGVSATMTKGIGTPIYMAPEVLDGERYSTSSDVYSFGIILFEAFTDSPPFMDKAAFAHPWDIASFVTSGRRPKIPDSCPEDYRNLTQRCWAHTGSERPTFQEVADTLEKMFNAAKMDETFETPLVSPRIFELSSPSSGSAGTMAVTETSGSTSASGTTDKSASPKTTTTASTATTTSAAAAAAVSGEAAPKQAKKKHKKHTKAFAAEDAADTTAAAEQAQDEKGKDPAIQTV